MARANIDDVGAFTTQNQTNANANFTENYTSIATLQTQTTTAIAPVAVTASSVSLVAGIWSVQAYLKATGTEATPFSHV